MNEHTTIRHHKHTDLHLFRRESGIWFAGFHEKGRYHRKSTGTNVFSLAGEIGEDWYLDCRAAIRIGKFDPRPKHTMSDAAKIALSRFEEKVRRGEKSKRYFDSLELLLRVDLLPFFGRLAVSELGPARWHEYLEHLRALKPHLSRETIHQHRNALRLCLNSAVQKEWIKAIPVLKIDRRSKRDTLPRAWFEMHELRLLLKAARGRIKNAIGERRRNENAECYDFMLWLANTGMRVGEAHNVRFCDVEIREDKLSNGQSRKYCLIKNIRGKRGTGECRSWYGAYNAFRRIAARKDIPLPSQSAERLFDEHHSDLLNSLLKETGLKFTNSEPRCRRDFVSFRHTYIAHRLINGVNVFDIAANCRTSVAMIEKHYARFLSPRYLTDLNRTTQPSTH